MGPSMRTELISQREWINLRECLRLSGRQVQIARLLVQGKADKQITCELGVSMSTVRTYMDRLFRKSNLHDRVELIIHVFRCVRAQSADDTQASAGTGQEDGIALLERQTGTHMTGGWP